MNIYFLVEGRHTEKKIYPEWLKYLIPELQRVEYYNEVIKNNYYIISGKGYPSILGDHLVNAVDKIQEMNNYDYLVLCVDADEERVEERVSYIYQFLEDKKFNLGKTEVVIIVQNRCIETWLLGNNKIFDSRQPKDSPLLLYAKYYDVSQNDPELMGKYDQGNHAEFHEQYLKEIFNAKNLTYTKKFPGEAQKKYYLEQLIKRIENNHEHLKTFQAFIEFCTLIRQKISLTM